MRGSPKAELADHRPRVAPVSREMAVVAPGDNALLRPGELLETANQALAARECSRFLAKRARVA